LHELFFSEAIIASDASRIEGKLTIPEYQRPYRWQAEQIERLIQDYRYYLGEDSSSTTPSTCPFYLGSVILHQSAEHGQLNIIDGQQRLTTLALMAFSQGHYKDVALQYNSPESQRQIRKNLQWIKEHAGLLPEPLDFERIHFTLVVTQSEDDAYRFFETQNTGGVRLSGPDIIKAHHLRAIDRLFQNLFASKWEELGDLNPVVGALLKGRYWESINLREIPSHRQSQRIRSAVVKELAEDTNCGEDVSFGQVTRIHQLDGGLHNQYAQQSYALRQPLNTGVNTVHYLAYFEGLRVKYLVDGVPHITGFNTFYVELIRLLEGCSYLKNLYDACLLMYISQFGETELEKAAHKLFRVIYSPRVSNQKAVRERSVSAFVRDYPVLDWIASTYTPQECFAYLDRFKLNVDPANLDKNSVKKRFIKAVCHYFNLSIKDARLADEFGPTLDQLIVRNQKLKELAHV